MPQHLPSGALRNVTYVLVSIASVIFIVASIYLLVAFAQFRSGVNEVVGNWNSGIDSSAQEQCAYYPTAAECLNGSGAN